MTRSDSWRRAHVQSLYLKKKSRNFLDGKASLEVVHDDNQASAAPIRRRLQCLLPSPLIYQAPFLTAQHLKAANSASPSTLKLPALLHILAWLYLQVANQTSTA